MKNIFMILFALGAAILLWCLKPVHAASIADSQAVQGQNQAITNSFNGAEPIRSIQISPNVPVTMRGGPAYFSGPPMDTGPLFIPLSQLVPILNAVKLDTSITEEDEIEATMEVLQYSKASNSTKVEFQIVQNKADLACNPLAIISIRADDNVVNSASLAHKLADMARSVGGTKIVFIKEGVTKRLHSSGWGVGISNNISVVNTSPTGIGGVAASGTGYSQGEAEYYSLPYLVAVVLK